jgi:hypothetical protein
MKRPPFGGLNRRDQSRLAWWAVVSSLVATMELVMLLIERN